MVELGVDDVCIHHPYDSPRDQADAWMLDVIDGTGGIPLLFFRSNESPGNMSHSRITPHPLYKHNNTAPRATECSIVPSCMESDAVSAGMAWRIRILPFPLIHQFSTATIADIIRIDNQNGGRGCRASKLQAPSHGARTDIQVIDNGSGMCKAGFAGDDAPRAVFP
jgi:hypothetical protein